MISESSLLANATTLWQLINVAENILTKRTRPAVAPLNDTEIGILGGWNSPNRLSDVIVFNTTTKTCQKVSAGGDYKFTADGNQCVQAGINKVVALVTDKDDKPAVISWTKGTSASHPLELLRPLSSAQSSERVHGSRNKERPR